MEPPLDLNRKIVLNDNNQDEKSKIMTIRDEKPKIITIFRKGNQRQGRAAI